MADITKELAAIENAKYGREVRKSIHDAIEAVNISATNSAFSAEQSAAEASEILTNIENILGDAVAETTQLATGSAQSAAESAQAASESARNAEKSVNDAVSEAVQSATGSAQSAAESAQAASESARNAEKSVNDAVSEAVQSAAGSAQSAAESAQAAEKSAQSAAEAVKIHIKKTETLYQTGTSSTTIPTGIWSANVPNTEQGKYLWTKCSITFTDDTVQTYYTVAYQGKDSKLEEKEYLTNYSFLYSGRATYDTVTDCGTLAQINNQLIESLLRFLKEKGYFSAGGDVVAG